MFYDEENSWSRLNGGFWCDPSEREECEQDDEYNWLDDIRDDDDDEMTMLRQVEKSLK